MHKIFYILFAATLTQSVPLNHNLQYGSSPDIDKLRLKFEENTQQFHTVGVIKTILGTNITLQSEPIAPNYANQNLKELYAPSGTVRFLLGHTDNKHQVKRGAPPNPLLPNKGVKEGSTSILPKLGQKSNIPPEISLSNNNEKVITNTLKNTNTTVPVISRNLEPPLL